MAIANITNNILTDSGTLISSLATSATTISTTSPLQGGGDLSANRTLSITQSGTASNGYLSSADWTTFNNKQNALTNPVTGTGTTNYLPKFTGTSTIGNSAVSDDGTTVTLISRILSGSTATFTHSSGDTIVLSKGSGPTIKFSKTAATAQDWAIAGEGTAFKLYNYTSSTVPFQIDASGNLGLGVTPSAWYSTFQAFQFGANGSSIFGRSENNMAAFASNAYVNSVGNFTYINTNTASYYQQLNGQHQWYNAPSGTAGTAISFTQAMTLFSTGNLAVGGTSDNGFRINVTGDVNVGSTNGYYFGGSSTAIYRSTNDLRFYVNSGDRMSITSAGNVGIGTTSPSTTLDIVGSAGDATTYGISTIRNSSSRGISFGAYSTSYTWIQGNVYGIGTAPLALQPNGGNVLIGTATDATGKLQVNGTVYATGFYESSDIRFKNVLETNPNINLSGIDVIKFTRKDNDINQVRYGYSAQQVQSILPDLVTGIDFLNVNYLDVHTLKIAQLEQEIKELKAKMN